MAYACPVCAEPQIDAEHLANHLAFTAIAGDDAHEEWLDATVAEWGQLGEAELAEVVVDHAEETDFPVDVDPADVEAAGHDHGHSDGGDRPPSVQPTGELDEDAQDVLAEARELTERMQDGGEHSEDAESGDGEDGGATDSAAGDSTDADSSDSETQ